MMILNKRSRCGMCALARDGWATDMKTAEELAVELFSARMSKHDMDLLLGLLKLARIQAETVFLRQLDDERTQP